MLEVVWTRLLRLVFGIRRSRSTRSWSLTWAGSGSADSWAADGAAATGLRVRIDRDRGRPHALACAIRRVFRSSVGLARGAALLPAALVRFALALAVIVPDRDEQTLPFLAGAVVREQASANGIAILYGVNARRGVRRVPLDVRAASWLGVRLRRRRRARLRRRSPLWLQRAPPAGAVRCRYGTGRPGARRLGAGTGAARLQDRGLRLSCTGVAWTPVDGDGSSIRLRVCSRRFPSGSP